MACQPAPANRRQPASAGVSIDSRHTGGKPSRRIRTALYNHLEWRRRPNPFKPPRVPRGRPARIGFGARQPFFQFRHLRRAGIQTGRQHSARLLGSHSAAPLRIKRHFQSLKLTLLFGQGLQAQFLPSQVDSGVLDNPALRFDRRLAHREGTDQLSSRPCSSAHSARSRSGAPAGAPPAGVHYFPSGREA